MCKHLEWYQSPKKHDINLLTSNQSKIRTTKNVETNKDNVRGLNILSWMTWHWITQKTIKRDLLNKWNDNTSFEILFETKNSKPLTLPNKQSHDWEGIFWTWIHIKHHSQMLQERRNRWTLEIIWDHYSAMLQSLRYGLSSITCLDQYDLYLAMARSNHGL